MDKMNELRAALLDLLHATREADLRIIVGGGYGIYLKREFVGQTGTPTLLDQLPEARSTNDLDLFLRPELLIEPERLRPLDAALKLLGYEVKRGAKHYQFLKNPDGPGTIKVDLLTGPMQSFRGSRAVVEKRRIKPRPSVGIHAGRTDEAVGLEEGLLDLRLAGRLSTGQEWEGTVFVPQPFTYLVMKLHAFRDRLEDEKKDFGSHHALDIYAVVATTIEKEWEKAKELSESYKNQPEVLEARRLVEECFSSPTGMGIIRLKESKYFEDRLRVREFSEVMRELFPPIPH